MYIVRSKNIELAVDVSRPFTRAALSRQSTNDCLGYARISYQIIW